MIARRKVLLGGLAASAAALLGGCERRMSGLLTSSDTHPGDYPTVKAVEYMGRLLSERTGGRLGIKVYAGLGFDEQRFVTHQYGIERARPANPHGGRMRMRVTNRKHIVTFDTSSDGGRTWRRFDRGMEVSGYHHNVRGGFLMLRPGLYAAGPGEAKFRDFRFTALEDPR